MKKATAYGIILLLSICIFANIKYTIAEKNTTDEWNVKLEFTDSTGVGDYVRFGEASDANNGPPPDDYDMPKPPSPPFPPYIRAWLDNDLEKQPFNLLLHDYRDLSSDSNTWNLTIIWVPDDSSSNTTITISWDVNNITSIGYDSVKLYGEDESNPVSNMLTDESYDFICPSNEAQSFQIQCKNEESNGQSDGKTPFLPVSIILAVIILFSLLRKK